MALPETNNNMNKAVGCILETSESLSLKLNEIS